MHVPSVGNQHGCSLMITPDVLSPDGSQKVNPFFSFLQTLWSPSTDAPEP